MKRLAGCVLAALLVAEGATAQEPELAPLVPPKAPWLKKNQKKKAVTKKKRPAPQATESKRGAPYVAAPPAMPPLALPPLEPPKPQEPATPPVEAARPPAVTAPVEAAKPSTATPPVDAPQRPATTPPAEAAVPLPPLVPLAPPTQVSAPPTQVSAPPTQVSAPLTPAAVPTAAVTAAPPAPSSRRGWKKPTAFAALGVGAAVAATGVYFGAKSHSDLNSAESAFHTNGGAYRATDIDALNSGNRAARTANVLFGVAGVLLATSALVAFAF